MGPVGTSMANSFVPEAVSIDPLATPQVFVDELSTFAASLRLSAICRLPNT